MNEALAALSSEFFGDYSSTDRTGEAATDNVVAGLLFDPLGAPMEKRNGLVVDACLTPAAGRAGRIAVLHIVMKIVKDNKDVPLEALRGLERRTVALNRAPGFRPDKVRNSLPRIGDSRCGRPIRSICVSVSSRLVEAGHSRRAAAAHFDVSVSFVVKLMTATERAATWSRNRTA